MNMLCFSTDLSSQDMAAWVQAIGSIVAIIAAILVAVWQGKKQHESALALLMAEKKHDRVDLAKTLVVLAKNTAKMMTSLTSKLDGREAVHKISEGRVHFDLGELIRLDNAIANIPLHELPDSLVTPTMIFSATIRQFRYKIELVLRIHREMDSEKFEDFFKTLGEMNRSFSLTCDDVESILKKLEKGA